MYEMNGVQFFFYTSVLVTTSRMLTFSLPKVVIYFVSCFDNRKKVFLYGKLCDVPILLNKFYTLFMYIKRGILEMFQSLIVQ